MYPFCKYDKIFTGSYFKDILDEVPFKQNKILSGSEWVLESRKTCWMSDSDITLEYSDKSMVPIKLTKTVSKIRDILNSRFGFYYDSVLINYYPDGGAGMRYHSDPIENKWDTNFMIVSFGATRKLVFREIQNFDIKIYYDFNDGDCVNMFDDCQDLYQHSIRKDKHVNDPRISLVFKRRKDYLSPNAL